MEYQHPYPSPEVEAAHPFVTLEFERLSPAEMRERARRFAGTMARRRSVRMFSPEPVPADLVETAVAAAGTAPSGANLQPWTFVAVSDPGTKRAIREAAEEEERRNYEGGRINEEWRTALAPLGTDWHKEFLEIAPWLVVLFEQRYGIAADGSRIRHYYVKESVGIAAGFFVAAVHGMGLATLPHTPAPMAFLSRILGRPENERPFVLFPVGYPIDGVKVPVLHRKPLDRILVRVDGGPTTPRRTDPS
jgi:nitroreductase